VDVVGLSGFNGGSQLRWSGWRSFASIFGPALRRHDRIQALVWFNLRKKAGWRVDSSPQAARAFSAARARRAGP
jgi:hypothetical protein